VVDERGRGAPDEGRPDDTGEPVGPSETPSPPDADAQEPEVGSSEWLLQQLTGGRRVGRRSAERDDEVDEAGEAEAPEGQAAAQDAAPAPEEVAPAPSGDRATTEPSAFDELLGSAVVPEEPVAAPVEPASESQTEFPVAFNWNLTPGEGGDPLVQAEPSGSAEPSAPDEGAGVGAHDAADVADAPPATGGEPAHDDAAEAQAAAWASFQSPETPGTPPAAPEPEPEASVAPEQAAPPAYRSPLLESSPAEAGSPVEPEPPTVETPIAAGSWVIPPAEPPTPVEPEQPRTIFDPPPTASTPSADDSADEQGHGLAALLGFGGAEEGGQSARSVIGDTTSIIPLVPGAVPPAPVTPPASEPVAGEPPSSGWAGSHQPDPWFDAHGHAEPAPPTNPVLPPIDAAALFEPATDTAAHRAAAPELDALLRSESRPEPPTLPSEHSLPTEPEAAVASAEVAEATPFAAAPLGGAPSEPTPFDAAPSEPTPFDAAPSEPTPFDAAPSEPAPTAVFPTVLPSEPDLPAAEAEVALGGVPSPATSPIDAASIAAASETAAFDTGAAGVTTGDDLPDDAGGVDDDEADGLAELFGDVVTMDDAEADEAEVAEAGPEPALPLRADDLDEAEQEPAAALEGPQLTATAPFFIPSGGVGDTDETDGIDDAADTGAHAPTADEAPATPATVWPDAGGAHAAAPEWSAAGAAAAGAAASAGGHAAAASAEAAAGQSSAPGSSSTPAGTGGLSTPVTASTSPSAAVGPTAAPAGPGLWGSRNNRILFSVAGGLAVLLVLIGLFALGTRIPSLFGAAKPAPVPTASATATPKPTPTPTPVPTVTPKPAPVGAGTHPWDALGGGECIQPFTSVWAQEFTVVDCGAPHTAQLVYTNLLSADPAAPYPGADALAGQVPGLCTASGVIDLNAAAAYPDLQVVGSFPATEQQWKDGQRSYYCFVNRSGGEPLTSSVAGAGPTG